ncbi:MAG: bifunctional acetate--CoA ligase family protein/GNAT family N-acetyltransferase [Planctomycetota bacterium]|nr:bifunctional acetate--CoA ligase family protein/GNAT family N-acetyltransferase [Planctomycetota bacterium]
MNDSTRLPDLVHDVIRPRRQPLDPFFKPASVALIGATEKEGSVGRTIMQNLIATSFGGTVFPVNPKRPAVLGVRAYPSVAAIPDPVELAVLVTPAASVPGLIKECVDAGVKAAVIISAGFKEAGPAGRELERQVLAEARRGGMRIVGPNCLGVMSPVHGLNATFAQGMARPGNVGFLSQSGALCTAILDWSHREHVGFSAFVSTGSMLDVGWSDLIWYLGDDPNTQSILIYMESIGDARGFLSAAREVALRKPIVVIHVGKSEQAAKAAASHTGALTASSAVLEAAFRRCGVTSVGRIEDLFDLAEVLGKQPRPKGPRLTILTNAGGPGVLATDALIGMGGELAPLADATKRELDAFLPAHWSHNNPIDILGDADPERYRKALEVAARDPHADGLLLILTPQGMTHPSRIAEGVAAVAPTIDKPVLASWMGGVEVAAGAEILNRAKIPTFDYPDTAARVFTLMWRGAYNLRGLYETPALAAGLDEREAEAQRARGAELVASVLKEGRTLLTELESKALLEAYGLPTVPTRFAKDAVAAVRLAEGFGFPVVLKLHSHTITHKTDVGGVKLNLRGADEVRAAFDAIRGGVGAGDFLGVTVQPMVPLDGYELIVGCSPDPIFGPVVLFGTGGQLVEVFKDRALGLPPFNATLARRLMEQTKILTALKGVRGRKPVDLAALENLLVRFGRLVVEQPRIQELDINPLLASGERLLALDARVVLHPASVPDAELPRPAVRAYPSRYVEDWTMPDGTRVAFRPIRPEDEPALAAFHATLSDRSVFLRYANKLGLGERIAHERLARLCFVDYDREIPLVVEHRAEDGKPALVAIGRLSKRHGAAEASFALLIADRFQGRGLGTELLRRLVRVARDEKIERLAAGILAENKNMQSVCAALGFSLSPSGQDGVLIAELMLDS